jgi:hypothetical protein
MARKVEELRRTSEPEPDSLEDFPGERNAV